MSIEIAPLHGTEQIIYRGGQLISVSINYIVPGNSVIDVRGHIGTSIPFVHPEAPELGAIRDFSIVEAVGSGVAPNRGYIVRVEWSLPEFAGPPETPPDDTGIEFDEEEDDFGTTIIEVPYISGIPSVVSTDDPFAPTSVTVEWSEHKMRVTRTLYRLERTVNIDDYGDAHRTAIDGELNKLHTINGRKHRFLGGTVTRIRVASAAGRRQVRYTWERSGSLPAYPGENEFDPADSLVTRRLSVPALGSNEVYTVGWYVLTPDPNSVPRPIVQSFNPYENGNVLSLPGLV